MVRLAEKSLVAVVLLATLVPGMVPFAQSGADNFFRLVRRAVTDENEAELIRLVRRDPWGFRQVINRLADLALAQMPAEDEGRSLGGYNRFVVSGLLAGIYMEETGDTTLAQRLRRMRSWTHEDFLERRRINILLAGAHEEDKPPLRALEKAVPACQRLEDDRCVGMLHGALGDFLEKAHRPVMAALNFEKAAEAFRQACALPRLRDALLARGQLLLVHGDHAEAATDLGAAAAVSQRVGDRPARVGSLLLLAEALMAAGRRQPALDALAEARNVAISADLPLLAARAILLRTSIRDKAGPTAGTAPDYEAAARLAEKGRDLLLASSAYLEAARAHAQVGDPARGAEDIEKALSAARLAGMEDGLPAMLLLAGDLHGRVEDWERAVRRLDEAARRFRESSDDAGAARALEEKGTTLLESEQYGAARQALQEALPLARESGSMAIEGRVEGGLAALALIRGDMDEARRRYGRSADLLESAGDSFQALRMRDLRRSLETPPASSGR
ncbi:MAG: tetratricopeptide repeat protein [Acidobacteria bacterium]|nr:tetratricopeptide repeat protein [Acidobacteriota bacterium]